MKNPKAKIRLRRPTRTLPWWSTYAQAHPLRVTIVVLTAMGGMTLLAYFVHLGVMPDLDWAGTNALLLYTACMAFMMGGYMALCTVGAGWLTRSYGPEINDLRQGGRGTVHLFLPAILTSLAIGLLLFFNVFKEVFASGFFFGFPAAGAIYYAFVDPQTGKRKKLELQQKISIWGNYFFLSSAWSFNLLFAALVFSLMSTRDGNDLWIIPWIFLCFVMNVAILKVKKLTLGFLFFLGVAGLFILCGTTGNGIALPKAVVRSLGMGDVPVSLLVTEAGCQQVNKLSGQAVCQLDPVDKTGLICPALLRSRIGSPFFIGLLTQAEINRWPLNEKTISNGSAPTIASGPWHTIALRPSEVLSWSRIQFGRSTDTIPSASSMSTIVTYLNKQLDQDWIQQQCARPAHGRG